MKYHFVGSVALLALTMAGPAAAADLPVKAPPLIVAPAVTGYFELSGLVMTRTKSRSLPLFSSAAAPGSGDILRSDFFDPGWQPGLEARGGFKIGMWGLEAAGFAIGNFPSASHFPNAAGVGSGFIETTPRTPYGLGGGTARLDSHYDSAIRGGEVNGTWDPMRGVTVLAGARYIELNEHLDMVGSTIATGTVFETDLWSAKNRMWGGQIGARVDFLKAFGNPAGPWIFEGNIRGGVFNNNIDSFVSRTGITLFGGTFDQTAYAVQGGLSGGYRLSEHVSLLVGYDALWLNGVALAPSQVQVTPRFNLPGTQGLATESLLYHGAKVTFRVSN
jgi:hypothetical protein